MKWDPLAWRSLTEGKVYISPLDFVSQSPLQPLLVTVFFLKLEGILPPLVIN